MTDDLVAFKLDTANYSALWLQTQPTSLGSWLDYLTKNYSGQFEVEQASAYFKNSFKG